MAKTSKTSKALNAKPRKITNRQTAPATHKLEPVEAVSTKPVAAASAEQRPVGGRRSKLALGTKMNPNRLLAELVGTFILTLVIIAAFSGQFILGLFASPADIAQIAQTGQRVPGFALAPFISGLALAIAVLATYKISGGLLNPAITLGQMALRRMNAIEGIGYILAQVLGAMLALSVATALIQVADPTTGKMAALDPANLFNHAATWKIFFAELLGAFVFGFGVAAALTYRALPRAILFGGSFIIGAGIALMAGAGILNPAVAVGVGLIGFGEGNLWAVAGIYLGGASLGVIIGMALYVLLHRGASVREATVTR